MQNPMGQLQYQKMNPTMEDYLAMQEQLAGPSPEEEALALRQQAFKNRHGFSADDVKAHGAEHMMNPNQMKLLQWLASMQGRRF